MTNGAEFFMHEVKTMTVAFFLTNLPHTKLQNLPILFLLAKLLMWTAHPRQSVKKLGKKPRKNQSNLILLLLLHLIFRPTPISVQ